jgi:uncharacterized protein YjiS (DUF1127 family)
VLAVLVERGRADVCSSPRASIGLSMLPASIAPSAAPAPTTVCSSSMKRMICPSASVISLSTAFSRSSNSPRYFAPATSAPMSSATIRLFFRPRARRRGRCAGRALDDRGLADAGLADQHRVVLGAAREHLDDAADLLVAADDRIELALARASSVRSRPYFSSAWYLGVAEAQRLGLGVVQRLLRLLGQAVHVHRRRSSVDGRAAGRALRRLELGDAVEQVDDEPERGVVERSPRAAAGSGGGGALGGANHSCPLRVARASSRPRATRRRRARGAARWPRERSSRG